MLPSRTHIVNRLTFGTGSWHIEVKAVVKPLTKEGMMKQIVRLAAASLAVLLMLVMFPEAVSAEKGPLEGAWKIVEVSHTSPDTSWTWSDPRPSLFIFGRGHYSMMFVWGTEPRALFADRSNSTDEEKLAAYGSFVANSGTYEVTGSAVTTRPIVAKNPNFMSGEYLTYEFVVQDDSLLLTLKSIPWNPDAKFETRYKLARLE